MSQPEVSYRYEYVSGVVTVANYPIGVYAYVVNRGAAEHYARARLWGGPPNSNGQLVGDSEDSLVEPGRGWVWVTDEIPDTAVMFADSYWVQILTTSPDLVPSASFRDTLAGWRDVPEPTSGDKPPKVDQEVDSNVVFAYFAPGDFSVFELPHRFAPPKPPIGSIEP